MKKSCVVIADLLMAAVLVSLIFRTVPAEGLDEKPSEGQVSPPQALISSGTAHVDSGITNLVWSLPTTNKLYLDQRIMLTTNLTTIRILGWAGSTNRVRVRQVGTLQTNLMLFMAHGDATNKAVQLAVLGEEIQPSVLVTNVVAYPLQENK